LVSTTHDESSEYDGESARFVVAKSNGATAAPFSGGCVA
jgi:hypothetical protein